MSAISVEKLNFTQYAFDKRVDIRSTYGAYCVKWSPSAL